MSNAVITNTVAIDSKKPTTKQELIAANIKLLNEQLEAGHSDAQVCLYPWAITVFRQLNSGYSDLACFNSSQSYNRLKAKALFPA